MRAAFHSDDHRDTFVISIPLHNPLRVNRFLLRRACLCGTLAWTYKIDTKEVNLWAAVERGTRCAVDAAKSSVHERSWHCEGPLRASNIPINSGSSSSSDFYSRTSSFGATVGGNHQSYLIVVQLAPIAGVDPNHSGPGTAAIYASSSSCSS